MFDMCSIVYVGSLDKPFNHAFRIIEEKTQAIKRMIQGGNIISKKKNVIDCSSMLTPCLCVYFLLSF